jgi:hypothetical protein
MTKPEEQEKTRNDKGQWQPGHSGNPNGRKRGGRWQVLELLDRFLAEEITQKQLMEAFRAEFNKSPMRFFERIIMPLAPKQLDIEQMGDITVIFSKEYVPKNGK